MVVISSCIILFVSLVLTPTTSTLFDNHILQLTRTRETTLLPINWTNSSQDLYSPGTNTSHTLRVASRVPACLHDRDNHRLPLSAKDEHTPWTGPTVSYEAEMECTEPCQPSNKALMSSQRWRRTIYCSPMSLAFFSAPNWTVMHPPNSTLPSYYILPFVIPENRDLSTATGQCPAGSSRSLKQDVLLLRSTQIPDGLLPTAHLGGLCVLWCSIH